MRRIELKTRDQMRFMRRAGLVVADIHRALRDFAAPGVTTLECDEVVREVIAKAGAKSNFLGYHGFPATVCISVNDEVVHGIPGKKRLRAGDIVSFDCGAYIVEAGKQWHGDAAITMIIGDEPRPTTGGPSAAEAAIPPDLLERRRQLDQVTHAALDAALAAVATGRRVGVVGAAVEKVVEDHGERFGWEAGIVEEFTGHGIGTAMHQAPDVLNYMVHGRTEKLRPGMVLAVEPMLTGGCAEVTTDRDGWTVRTKDGSDAVQWEHSIAIVEDGVSVLTAPDRGAALLAPFGITPVDLDD
ncbi:type I methionyl aminopeptidase [Schaalia sp. 19OD2882]|uniref:type I methionyl aminopeptidase n=1 Tax=Schaalia sp. 19OD2882 TaxID=2794089 RepID=UPI001C1F162A|nr:type I methionyl aminopeptidase [Schaalia sp. 19OD2882]QWW19241.1 type I methionyl aminopeptidase [Schaalia sp. 19OD2882]